MAALLALALVSGCSSDGSTAGQLGGLPVKALLQAAMAQLTGKGAETAAAPAAAPDPAQVAASRKMLEDAGVPLYIVQNKALGILAFVTKLAENGDVVTWSTPDYMAVSLRDGMVVATRGLGPDILSADAPTTQAVQAGKGTTSRTYYFLDAADQQLRYDYSCSLKDMGRETITLIGKDYDTRRVDEACTGQQGSFVNSYWFDRAAKLRQSSQLLAPGIENLLVQKIID